MHQECQQPQGLLMSHATTPGQTPTAGIALEVLTWGNHLAEQVKDVEVDFRSLAVAVEEESLAGKLPCQHCRLTEKLQQEMAADGGAAHFPRQEVEASMPGRRTVHFTCWPCGIPGTT